MKVIKFLVGLACLLSVTACCTQKLTVVTQTMMPQTGDIIADLDVRSEKISESYTTELSDRDEMTEEELKNNAVFEVLKKAGADILVAPQYKITSEECSDKTTFTVFVSGYPAFYTNFRQVPMAERMELRELNEGSAYMVVKKSAAEGDLEYDRDVIVVPVRSGSQILNMDDVTLERVVLKGKNAPERGECPPMREGRTQGKERPSMRERTPTESVSSQEGGSSVKGGKPLSMSESREGKNLSRNIQAAESAKKSTQYTLKQCQAMKVSGIALSSISVACLCVVTPTLCYYKESSGSQEKKPYFDEGLYMMIPGFAAMIPGVTLWTIGDIHKKRLIMSGNTPLKARKSTAVTLSLQSSEGVGLTLRF